MKNLESIKTSLQHQLQRLVFATLIVAICLIVFPSYSQAGLIIRGGQCSANAFEKGAESVDSGYINGLSVNFTEATSKKSNYVNYLNGIGGYGQYCVATSDAIELVGGKLKKAPIPGDEFHTLLSGKVKDIARKLTKY